MILSIKDKKVVMVVNELFVLSEKIGMIIATFWGRYTSNRYNY